MSQPKLIATLLRSIADLLDEKGVHISQDVCTEKKTVFDLPTETSYTSFKLTDKNIDDVVGDVVATMNSQDAKHMARISKEAFGDCKSCTNGGHGRHRKGCPRGHGPVVDRSKDVTNHEPLSEEPEIDPGEEGEEEDWMDTTKNRIDEINASEVKHKCCGSKGWRHKAVCDHGGSSFPEKVGSKFGVEPEEMEETEKQPDLKTFECEACGKRFQAEPDYVKCECGSNEICWPIE
jgi:hypothetical protein